MFKFVQYCSAGTRDRLRNSFTTNLLTKCEKPPFNLQIGRRSHTAVPKIRKSEGGKEIKWSVKFYASGLGISMALGVHAMRYHGHAACKRKTRVHGTIVDDKILKFDWKLFWKYIKPHLLHLMGAIVAALVVAYLNIRIPQMLGAIINVVSKHSQESIFTSVGSAGDTAEGHFYKAVKAPAVDLFLLYIAQSCFTFLYIHLLSGVGERMAANMRHDLFESVLRQDIEFFDRHRTGELMNRLTTDVQDFKSSFKQLISQGLRALAQLAGGTVSLFLISPALTTVALVCIPTAVVIGSCVGSLLRRKSREAQAQNERAAAVLDEAISNVRTVRSHAAERAECATFDREAELARQLNEELGLGIAVFQAGTNLFLNGLVLGTLYAGGSLLASGSLTAGDLMAFLVASQTVQRSLAQASLLVGAGVRGVAAAARVMEYLDVKPRVPLEGGDVIPAKLLRGHIRFQNVSFAYPTRPENIVLSEFTLDVASGRTVALVGVSGSGKSTVANLLERFYEPTSGRIYLDGHPITELCPRWLRGTALGLIEQTPTLFAATVMENIRYGDPSATDQQVIEAARKANAHEFIVGFSEGYRTQVGERGTALSGGQKQRIAIARALLKDPTVLVLDEATSALDAHSEALVQRALDAASRGRTVLVIAHRLSTIKNADVIVVMKHGRIVEIGDHESLKKSRGHYWNLVREQEEQEQAEKTTRVGS